MPRTWVKEVIGMSINLRRDPAKLGGCLRSLGNNQRSKTKLLGDLMPLIVSPRSKKQWEDALGSLLEPVQWIRLGRIAI